MKTKQTVQLHISMTAIGGLGYNLIELLWRGRTHWSMFLVGGACFEIIGCIHHRLDRRPLLARSAVCAAAVTAVELISGCILNLRLGLGVWDYSAMKGNIRGQVCPLYSLFWMILSAVACPVYRCCYRFVQRRVLRLPTEPWTSNT